MTTAFDRASAWRSPSDPPEPLALGGGTLRIDDRAVLRIPASVASETLEELDLWGWQVLASRNGTICYEGEIVDVGEETTGGRRRYVIECEPGTVPR